MCFHLPNINQSKFANFATSFFTPTEIEFRKTPSKKPALRNIAASESIDELLQTFPFLLRKKFFFFFLFKFFLFPLWLRYKL